MYHPQPYDQHAYWAYGAYGPATNVLEYPYPIYGHPMVGTVELPQYPKQQMIAPATEAVNANTGMVPMVNQAHDATTSGGTDDMRSSSSPSVGSSAAQRQSPKARVPIRVTDPETKEDLTEKLAEMYAQVNEERRKKGESQTNTASAVTPMSHPPDTDTTGHALQSFEQPMAHGTSPMVYQPAPQYERRSGGNRGGYSSRRGGGGGANIHYRPNQTAQVKPRVAPQRGHRPFHNNSRETEEVRVNRVQPQVQDSKQWAASNSGAGVNEVSPRSGKLVANSGQTGRKDRIASLTSGNESVDGDVKSAETVTNNEEKKLPEVTCIVDENREIIGLVSDSTAVIVDVNLKDLVKETESGDDSGKVSPKESLDDSSKPSVKTCDEPSASVESISDKIDTSDDVEADVTKLDSAKEPAKEAVPIFPSSNVITGLPERRDGGAILPKTATWGNKFSQKHAAIVKPMPLAVKNEPVSQRDLKIPVDLATPVSVVQTTKTEEYPSSSSEKTAQKVTAEANPTPEQPEQTAQALPQRPAASTWSARLGASLTATANKVTPQPTVPVSANSATVFCNNDSNRVQTPVSSSTVSSVGEQTQNMKNKLNSEPDRSASSAHVPVSAKSSFGSSLGNTSEKRQNVSVNEKDQNNDSNLTNEASRNVLVDQDGFQEVKQKRKPKQYSGVLAAGAPQPNNPVMRASSRNTSSANQSTINSGALSHVPSAENSSRPPVNSLANPSPFSRQMPNRSSSSELTASGAPPAFRGRSFGRPPLRPRGGWGRGALRSNSTVNSAENVKSNEDLTEVTIMKSLQFETSNPARHSEINSSTSWADDVEPLPLQQSSNVGSAASSSWSQIVRKGGFSAKRDVGYPTYSKSSAGNERTQSKRASEDSRPTWARGDSSTSVDSSSVPKENAPYQEKESYDVVSSRRERSISPKLRQSSRQNSFSTNDTTASPSNADMSNKANTDFSINTSSTSSSLAAPAAAPAAAPIPRAHSPKRRQMSPPTFSSLRTESDKRIGANRARPTVTAYANRSPSPPLVSSLQSSGTATSAGAGQNNDLTNDFQRLQSSSTSNRPSVFATVQNNPPKPRQTAVVNPMKFE